MYSNILQRIIISLFSLVSTFCIHAEILPLFRFLFIDRVGPINNSTALNNQVRCTLNCPDFSIFLDFFFKKGKKREEEVKSNVKQQSMTVTHRLRRSIRFFSSFFFSFTYGKINSNSRWLIPLVQYDCTYDYAMCCVLRPGIILSHQAIHRIVYRIGQSFKQILRTHYFFKTPYYLL